MKGAERDQTGLFFARTVGKSEEHDASGNPTGRFRPVYEKPVFARMNLSGKRGAVTPEDTGRRTRAKRFAVTCEVDLPVDEHTAFWIDRQPFPEGDEERLSPPDYTVDNVNRTKNSVTYTLLEVREG